MYRNAPTKCLTFWGHIISSGSPLALLLYGERYFIALGINIDAIGLKH